MGIEQQAHFAAQHEFWQPQRRSRRSSLLNRCRLAVLALTLGSSPAWITPSIASDVGRRFPSERQIFVDRETGTS